MSSMDSHETRTPEPVPRERVIAYMEHATSTVHAWPEWQQMLLGWVAFQSSFRQHAEASNCRPER